ncbi:MAG: DUF1902 domain-containing protein [Pseudomonadota bacterium]|nr:DUF1902 domain-containing protein [Pseudomonadota bacterium]
MAERIVDIAVLVRAEWDGEAGVWVATSEDVPGLVVEHSDFRALQEMVLELVPLLLAENKMLPPEHGTFEVPVHIAAQAISKGRAKVAA